MNFRLQISFLQRTVHVLPALVSDLTEDQFRWKPGTGNWSILEILGHMLEEERHDFPLRFQMTLDDPNQPWPSYDPEGVIAQAKYNEKEPQLILDAFLDERRQKLAWLNQLSEPEWDRTYVHPSIGPLRAGDLFLSWVAHDQLHVRQIAKRCYEMINQDGAPYQSDYAGNL